MNADRGCGSAQGMVEGADWLRPARAVQPFSARKSAYNNDAQELADGMQKWCLIIECRGAYAACMTA